MKNRVKLGSLTSIRTGKLDANASSENGKYPFFTCSKEPLRIDSYSYNCECVLVAGNGDLNVKYYDGKFDAYQRTYIIESTDKSKLLVKYLYFFLDIYVEVLRTQSIGGVIKYIKLGNLTDAMIPLPSIEEQEVIVDHLEKCNDLLNRRIRQLAILDQLVKSRFIELFGDLDLNSMDWVQKPLGEVCEQVKRYPTFCNMEYIQSGVRVIRIGNILIDGHIDTNDENYVFVYEDANNDYPDTVIEENDIIMAVRGDGSAAKRIGIVTEPKLFGANISPNLIRIKAKQELLVPLFLFYYLTGEVGQARLDAFVNKTAKKNIAAKDIVKVITPIPPIKLQRQFAAFVAQTDKSKYYSQKFLTLCRLAVNIYEQEWMKCQTLNF